MKIWILFEILSILKKEIVKIDAPEAEKVHLSYRIFDSLTNVVVRHVVMENCVTSGAIENINIEGNIYFSHFQSF